MFEITLPHPPSVNSYWSQRVVKATKGPMAGKYIAVPFLTDKARQFREDAMKLALGRKPVSSGSAIAVHVMVYPPDRRARDLDNLAKGILDALVHAKILRDDADIWDLRFTRQCLSAPPGRVVVRIWPINVATIAEIQPGDNAQQVDDVSAFQAATGASMHDVTFDAPKPRSTPREGKLFKMGNATEHVPRRRSPPAPTEQRDMISENEKPF